MRKPFKLTLSGVKKAAREFYRRGKLTAQHPRKASRKCVYALSSGYHCAIGAALPSDLALSYAREGYVRNLLDLGAVEYDIKIEDKLRLIQDSHDGWANHSRHYGVGNPTTVAARNGFLALIGLKPPKAA
jgi:hypothetical protein